MAHLLAEMRERMTALGLADGENEPGGSRGEGVEFPDGDTAMWEAADAALAMTRDQAKIAEPFQLEVSSDQGPVGSLVVQVLINPGLVGHG